MRPLPDEELRAEGLALIERTLEGIELGDLRTERIAEVGGAAGVLCAAACEHAPCPVLVVVPPHR